MNKFWEKLEQIEEISVSTGMKRVDGHRGIYQKTLKLIMAEIEKYRTALDEFLDAGDLDSFRIAVHSMKSSLANIGAMELADEAYKLETASAKRDIRFCGSNLQGFLDKLNGMREGLDEAFSLIARVDGPLDVDQDLSMLFERMLEAFDDLDLMLINEELDNLDTFEIGGALNEHVERIKDAVMIMDFETARTRIQHLLKSA